jgi:mono/diheme cytochrome c family protein
VSRGILLLIFAAAGCSDKPAAKAEGTKIENAFHGALQDRSSKSPDEALFVEKCGMCHRQMGMGTVILARRMKPEVAMLEARGDLSVEQITAAARQGIGNMPRISRGEVSNAQLAQISAYLSKGGSGVPQK